jgi:hypothetical protein
MNITKRYVHPQEHTILEAMEKVRVSQGGHNFGHNAKGVAQSGRAEAVIS